VPRILIAARGELSPGALQIKGRKKKIFLKIWRRVLGGLETTWHATAELEASHIKNTFNDADIVLCGDQSSLPKEPLPPRVGAVHARLVFISRVSPKKNLDMALRALQGISGSVSYDIFGPIEDAAYWNKCKALIAALPSNVKVKHRGELRPEEVRQKFGEYDAFLFPTRGENFGHVIAESLSASCPVICTDTTPWTERLRHGGGLVIEPATVTGLREILHQVVAASPAERQTARLEAARVYREWHTAKDQRSILSIIRIGRN
jgi:glycosyltransferase involved in cell wall biosynthesis